MADVRNRSNQGSADFAGSIKAVRTVGGEVRIMVAQGDTFEYYLTRLYRAMGYAHISATAVSALPFSEEEFIAYGMDALHVRVQRVNREPSRLPYQGWALPAPLATMLASVGEVTQEAPYLRIVPMWTGEDSYFMGRSEWNDLSMRLRSVEASINVLLVDTIERDPKGREDLMTLIPKVLLPLDSTTPAIPGELEVEAVYGYKPVDAISAATYVALGMVPELAVDPTLGHPLMLPGYRIDTDVAMLVVDRLAQVKSA